MISRSTLLLRACGELAMDGLALERQDSLEEARSHGHLPSYPHPHYLPIVQVSVATTKKSQADTTWLYLRSLIVMAVGKLVHLSVPRAREA